MIQKVTRRGDELVLVFNPAMIEQLAPLVEEGMSFDISAEGPKIILTPLIDPERQRRFEAALASTNARYGDALRRLGMGTVDHGNMLLLDKSILELLGLEEDGEVQLAIRDGALIITPVDPKTTNDARFQAALEQFMTTRAGLLNKLSQ